MTLTEQQRATVAQWIADGLKLSEVQTRLDKELGVRLTYMEMRFLMDDLKLQPKDQERPAVAPAPAPAPAAKPSPMPGAPAAPAAGPAPGNAMPPEEIDPFDEAMAGLPPEEAPAGGSVSVQLDQLTRPGALVSGKVTFSDGKKADWYLDQMGRLGLSPEVPGYRPQPADVSMFQMQLQAALSRAGF